MAKYKDVASLGRSKVAEYRPREAAMVRHQRRLDTNLKIVQVAEGFCAESKLSFVVSNEGHHWRFYGQGMRADWWPSSAKLVFDQKWERGIHAHDIYQVIGEIKRRWRATLEGSH